MCVCVSEGGSGKTKQSARRESVPLNSAAAMRRLFTSRGQPATLAERGGLAFRLRVTLQVKI